MDRRSLIKNAGLASILAAGVAPAVHAQAAIRWRLASSFPKSLDTIFGAAEVFADRVKKMSGGKFEVSVHAAGELMPALGVVDGVQQGSVEVAHTAPYYFFGKDECFALGCAIPFGLNSRQMTAWMVEGNGTKLMREFYTKFNIVNFPGGNTGAQMGGWFRKEIKSVADLKGVKMRIGGMAGLIMAKLGVVPQLIGGPDIYPALEKGTIDAAEWVGPYDDEKLGFNKVAKFYYYPGFWEGGPMLHTLVNEKKWNELPKHYQAALATACAEANVWMPAKYDELNPIALRKLVASGTQLRPFPRAVLEAAEKASYEIYDELGSKSAHWKRVYPEWKKFRDEQFLWARVADHAYDTYAFNSKIGMK